MKSFIKQIPIPKLALFFLLCILTLQAQARWSGQVVTCSTTPPAGMDGCLIRDCDGAAFYYANHNLSGNPPVVGDRVIYNESGGNALLLDYVTTYTEVVNNQTLTANLVLGTNSVLVVHGGGTIIGSVDQVGGLCYLAGGSNIQGALSVESGDLRGKATSTVNGNVTAKNNMNVVDLVTMNIVGTVNVAKFSPITLSNSTVAGDVIANELFFVDIHDNTVSGNMTVRKCYGFDMDVDHNTIAKTMTVSSNTSDGLYTYNAVGLDYIVAYNTGFGLAFHHEDIQDPNAGFGTQLLKIHNNTCGINYDHFDVNGKMVINNNSGTLGFESFTVEGLAFFQYNLDEIYIDEGQSMEKVRIWDNDGVITFQNSFPNDDINIKNNTDYIEIVDVYVDGNTVIKFNNDVDVDGEGCSGNFTSSKNTGAVNYTNVNIDGNMTSSGDGDLLIDGCNILGDLTIFCTPTSCSLVNTNVNGTNSGCPSCKMGAVTQIEETIDNEMVGLQVFPNPTQGKFEISLGNGDAVISHLTATDLRGQTVMAKELGTARNHTEVDLSQVSPGIYFIHITTSKGKLQPVKMVVH